MEKELTALEQPLRQGLILRLMCSQSTHKRSACLEDPTKSEMEQEHSYHENMILSFALKGVAKVFYSGGGFTQGISKIGSASPIDNCDSWLLTGNTIWARYKQNKFRVIARKGVRKGYKKGEGETLYSAYKNLNSYL